MHYWHAILYFIIISNWSSLFHCSLNNIKEECARNSVFQLLYHLPPFRSHVLDKSNGGTVTNALRNIFTLMQTSEVSFYCLLSHFLIPPSPISETYNDYFTPRQGMSNMIVAMLLWLHGMPRLKLCFMFHTNNISNHFLPMHEMVTLWQISWCHWIVSVSDSTYK